MKTILAGILSKVREIEFKDVNYMVMPDKTIEAKIAGIDYKFNYCDKEISFIQDHYANLLLGLNELYKNQYDFNEPSLYIAPNKNEWGLVLSMNRKEEVNG